MFYSPLKGSCRILDLQRSDFPSTNQKIIIASRGTNPSLSTTSYSNSHDCRNNNIQNGHQPSTQSAPPPSPRQLLLLCPSTKIIIQQQQLHEKILYRQNQRSNQHLRQGIHNNHYYRRHYRKRRNQKKDNMVEQHNMVGNSRCHGRMGNVRCSYLRRSRIFPRTNLTQHDGCIIGVLLPLCPVGICSKTAEFTTGGMSCDQCRRTDESIEEGGGV